MGGVLAGRLCEKRVAERGVMGGGGESRGGWGVATADGSAVGGLEGGMVDDGEGGGGDVVVLEEFLWRWSSMLGFVALHFYILGL